LSSIVLPKLARYGKQLPNKLRWRGLSIGECF